MERSKNLIYYHHYELEIGKCLSTQELSAYDSLKEFQENSTDKIRKYQYKLMADYLSEALDRTKNLQ